MIDKRKITKLCCYKNHAASQNPKPKKSAPRRRRKTEGQRERTFQSVRIGDLNKVFAHRYGGCRDCYVLPDDDAGRDDLRILLQHYAEANPRRMGDVIAARAPWLVGAEHESFLATKPERWTATALAHALSLREDERREEDIRTIGSIEVSTRQRKLNRKKGDLKQKEMQRRKDNKPTRAEWLAIHSKSREKPWEALGMKRSNYYRLGLHKAENGRVERVDRLFGNKTIKPLKNNLSTEQAEGGANIQVQISGAEIHAELVALGDETRPYDYQTIIATPSLPKGWPYCAKHVVHRRAQPARTIQSIGERNTGRATGQASYPTTNYPSAHRVPRF